MAAYSENDRIYRIALLVSLSCVLQISESMIPHPVPGLRLGLANMITLVALVTLGFRTAIEIACFRTLLSSLLMGTFMSPTFILSFSGALLSTLVMGALFRISTYYHRYGFSLIGISIAGALTHNLVQLFLAYLILVKHRGIFVFFPWLCYGAVGMGWLTGAVAGQVCRMLEFRLSEKSTARFHAVQSAGPASSSLYVHSESFLHRLRPDIKIYIVFFLSLFILFLPHIEWLAFILALLILVFTGSGISPAYLLTRVRKYVFLILIAFCMPLFFNSGSTILYKTSFITLTHEGLDTGGLFALRIITLILISSVLVRTASLEDLTAGLSVVLSPLKYLGLSVKRIAGIFSLSLSTIPHMQDYARTAIRNSDFTKVRNIRHFIPILSALIVTLYIDMNPENKVWKSTETENNDQENQSTDEKQY